MSAAHNLVDWELARKVAHRVAQRHPVPPNYNRAAMEQDFEAFTATAEQLVAVQTGLHSAAGPARGMVTDRAGWVDANINSFKRLLAPLADKLLEKSQEAKRSSKAAERFAAPAMRKLVALEVGAMLGWMSARVLGQYDLLVVESESDGAGRGSQSGQANGQDAGQAPDQDMVYYVGPNIASLEWRHGFPPDEFRLWIALHEVTHRMQFTGVPWLKEHFLSLVEATMTTTDLKQVASAIRQFAEARKQGQDPFADGGIQALLATPEQREVLAKIMGMMSLLEGHGDVTMDRAGAEHLSEIARFREVLNYRRSQVRGAGRLLRRLIGLEAKFNQYIAGERFIAAVEQSAGEEFLDRAWQGPENLPTLAEIREPETWLARLHDSVEPAEPMPLPAAP